MHKSGGKPAFAAECGETAERMRLLHQWMYEDGFGGYFK